MSKAFNGGNKEKGKSYNNIQSNIDLLSEEAQVN